MLPGTCSRLAPAANHPLPQKESLCWTKASVSRLCIRSQIHPTRWCWSQISTGGLARSSPSLNDDFRSSHISLSAPNNNNAKYLYPDRRARSRGDPLQIRIYKKSHFVPARNGRIMTSRPTLGHRQPVQRSLSTTTNVVQRPQPHRTLSQQFPSTSPARRSNDSFVDLTFDGPEGAQGRYGTIPRMGSQLRLEILDSGNTEMVHSPKTTADLTPTQRPVAPPRGRPQLHFDTPNTSNLSPCAAQDGSQNESAVKPMPLPIRPGQYAPPGSGKARVPTVAPAKRDARPKPYTLEVPAIAPRYPPNGTLYTFIDLIYAN